ncbi:5089_t:CDS:1, partial [Cetraspora pellucida]
VHRNSYYPLIEEAEKTIWEKIHISSDNAQLSITIINLTILNNDNIAENDELDEDDKTELEIIDQYKKTLYDI